MGAETNKNLKHISTLQNITRKVYGCRGDPIGVDKRNEITLQFAFQSHKIKQNRQKKHPTNLSDQKQ